ncbi:MAG: [FeFe] hydrogenase H-cluster maturation GTPase HydF [Candidatus Atribacteria bacterium]|nr:[FeFe] hydrogenase H-cluster maturation GTPase HydF [Candidatus Atribacteria bacterium]
MASETAPRSIRPHIGIFGRRNVGKSSLINALTDQEVAIVSDVPGTTTDPVFKAIELLPFGPVVIVDTAGLDDVGFLGDLRKKKSLEILHRCDVALLVWDDRTDFSLEKELLQILEQEQVLTIGVHNKIDQNHGTHINPPFPIPVFRTSTLNREGIPELKTAIVDLLKKVHQEKPLVRDLIKPGDLVVLVVPIDLGAPKGRLILPQVQTIREILDAEGTALIVKERELVESLQKLHEAPRLVITDSQVFHKVAGAVPPNVFLTSFSILFARYKGDLLTFIEGVRAVEQLQAFDRVLIAEACSHHPLPDDIGRVKIPRWLQQRLGINLRFDVVAGPNLPDDLAKYKLIIHCGGCMINQKEMLYRLRRARENRIPITNYGVLIAYLQGILPRVIEIFPEAQNIREEIHPPEVYRKLGGKWSV